MQPINEVFLPDPSLDEEEMKDLQLQIAEQASFTDAFDFDPKSAVVAGIDQAFIEDERAVSGIVVMEDGDVVEKVHAVVDVGVPYVPGLLAFREGESIVAAMEKLERDPDLLLIDGSGRIHFREAGLATHIGLLFDRPAVGVAKNLLCGTPLSDGKPLPEGAWIAIKADGGVETAEHGSVIGYAFQSKQYKNTENRHINPLYVSPGHRLSNITAVELVAQHCTDHKLPEPVHKADAYVSDVKEEI